MSGNAAQVKRFVETPMLRALHSELAAVAMQL
jgi:hypothetical protein